MRSIYWDDDEGLVKRIDPRLPPEQIVLNEFRDFKGLGQAITTVVVRGAVAVGAAPRSGPAWGARPPDAVDSPALPACPDESTARPRTGRLGSRITAVNGNPTPLAADSIRRPDGERI